MPNELKFQEGQTPVDEHLRPIKVDDLLTSLEIASNGNGARVTGEFKVLGKLVVNSDGDILLVSGKTGTTIINKKVGDTTAGIYTGLNIAFSKTGASTSNNTMYALLIESDNTTATDGVNVLYGIYNNPTLTHTADAGSAVAVTGLKQVVTGSTNGTSYGYGIEQRITGSDTQYGILQQVDDGQIDIKMKSSADTGDYCTIATGTHGATTITTEDDDLAAAHLTLDIDGDIILKPESEIYFHDGSNNIFTFGIGNPRLRIADDSQIANFFGIDVGDHGETSIYTTDADAAIAHLNIEPDGHVEFDGCAVGFDLGTPTYNASDTDVSFINGNKQFVTFGSGNITDLNLIFPETSGNFVLLLKQDGTGSRTVTNYKAWDLVNSDAADGSATVKFAGGSNPTLTTDANHVDIISIFWDADNQIAYGVASLDFQF